jgi:hypothetical protein
MGAAIPGKRGKYHSRGANGPVPIPDIRNRTQIQ